MKVKYFLKAFCGAALLVAATSCNDWLKEEEPGKSTPEDYFALGKAAIRAVNAAYTPLAWEFNSTYFSEWFIGDIASDDALKGGQNLSDMADAYDIENFKTNANNSLLRDFYRAQFQGIQRCNLAMQEVEAIEPDADMTAERKTCLMGEAYFMRAYYYFRLVRIFGGVPYVDKVIDSSKDWKQPRATAEEIYNHIIDDLKLAEQMLWNKSKYADADLGRATKGAAQAMLLKTYLYMHDYNNAYEWGKKFFEEQKNEYSLCPNYSDNFTLAGENGPESVFEIQYMADPTSDYGEGFGFTRGSFTTILTRSRAASLGGNAGWGFNHPTQNLYDEFEPGDPRREATISKPSDSEVEANTDLTYLGSPYNNNKTSFCENGIFVALDHATRSPMNYRLIRLSDVMLMYAEIVGPTDEGVRLVNKIRTRAGLAELSAVQKTENAFLQCVEDERRRELAFEGIRWHDLVRHNTYMEKVRAKFSDKAAGTSVYDNYINNVQPGTYLYPIPDTQMKAKEGLYQQNEAYK